MIPIFCFCCGYLMEDVLYILYDYSISARGSFYWHGLTLITACISNHMPGKMWDEITYPFLNFNGFTVEF